MNFKLRHFLTVFLLSSGFVAGALANTESLEKNSPFLPPGYKPPAQRPTKPTTGKPRPKPSGKLEFRGAAKLDGKWEFSIYDVKKRRGYWVTMNDPDARYLVTSYNEKAKSITLGGEASQTLKLKEPMQRRMPSYRTPRTRTKRTPSIKKSTTNTKGTRPTPSSSSRSSRSSNTARPGDIPPDIKALLDSLK